MRTSAIAGFAVVLLGSSAAIAQPNGHGPNYRACYEQPFGPSECAQLRQRADFEHYRQQNATVLPGFLMDPATNMPVTVQQYLASYPWSDKNTWQYDAVRNVWVDLTPQEKRGPNYRACYERPFGPAECAQLRQRADYEHYRQQNATGLPGFLMDPATNMPVTVQQYLVRYPWSDKNTWQYDAVRNVWVDLTPQEKRQTARNNHEGDRGRERERERDRDLDGDRDRGDRDQGGYR